MDIEKRDESVLTSIWIIVEWFGGSFERIRLKVQWTGETLLLGMWCCKAKFEPMCIVESLSHRGALVPML